MKRRLTVVAVLLTALGAPSALAASANQPFLGTWGARMSTAQLTNAGFDARLAGTFRLVLNKDGTYRTYNSLDRWSSGTFTATGRKIVFAKDVACKAGGFDSKGVYTWAIAKERLRLRVSSDPCGGRMQTLTYPLWKRR